MKAVLNIHTGAIVVGIAGCLWTSNWAAAGWALCALRANQMADAILGLIQPERGEP